MNIHLNANCLTQNNGYHENILLSTMKISLQNPLDNTHAHTQKQKNIYSRIFQSTEE